MDAINIRKSNIDIGKIYFWTNFFQKVNIGYLLIVLENIYFILRVGEVSRSFYLLLTS